MDTKIKIIEDIKVVEVIGAIMEVEVIKKMVIKEEVGVVIKVAVEAVTKEAVEVAIKVAQEMDIREGVVNIKETKPETTKTVVIIKGPKEVIQMNMTIEVKVDTVGIRENIVGCKELVGRKDTEPIMLF